MTATLLGMANLVPHGTAEVQHAAGLALDDGTVLLAWTGVLQHRLRDLSTVLGEVTLPGTTYVLLGTPSGAVLLDDAGRAWAVSTNPLTVATRSPIGPQSWDDAGGWHAATGGSTVAAVDYQGHLTTYPGGGEIPVPSSWAAGVWPNDDTSVYVSTGDWAGGRAVHTLTPGGSWALHTTGPDIPGGDYTYPFAGAIPHGDDWLWPSIENTSPDGYAETFVLRDTSGAVVHTDPWPSLGDDGALFSIGGASPLPNRQGAVVAGLGRAPHFGSGGVASAAAFVVRNGEVARVDLPLPRTDVDMMFGQSESAIVSVSPNGSTAVVLLQSAVVLSDAPGLAAWTIDLGGGRHAQLRVAVPDGDGHPWSSRLVGDESWEHGPGRMKVPDPDSPSGWSMEVKPGDDTTNATWVRLATLDGWVAAFRVIPWPGRP